MLMRYRGILLVLFMSLPWSAFAIDETTLEVWANEAIVGTYSYNYQNFLARQKAIATYFTSQGWINYTKALTAAKLPESIQKNAYYVSAVATMPPTIKSLRDNYWQAEMPLLVVYQNPQYQQKQNIDVTIEFTSVPANQGVRGLAIASIQAKEIKPSCKCDM